MTQNDWITFAVAQYIRVGMSANDGYDRANKLIKNDERVLQQDPEEVAYDDWLNTFPR